MSDDLISRKYLLECAEYDNNGRLIIPYRYVKNAPTAFDKEKMIEEIKEKYGQSAHWETIKGICEIIEKGGLN